MQFFILIINVYRNDFLKIVKITSRLFYKYEIVTHLHLSDQGNITLVYYCTFDTSDIDIY
jgi:hypothetical protein